VDFNSAVGRNAGLTNDKLRAVVNNDLTVFNELECLVIELSDAMVSTPANISDELIARLRNKFSEEQLLQLGAQIASRAIRCTSLIMESLDKVVGDRSTLVSDHPRRTEMISNQPVGLAIERAGQLKTSIIGSDFIRPLATCRRLSLKRRFHHQYFLNYLYHFRGALHFDLVIVRVF